MNNVNNLLDQLNPEQQQAVQHLTGPAVVLAGAGSGKTKVLTTRAAWLMLEHQIDPNQIMLVTFTNKAASEINDRLLKLTNLKLPFAGTFHSLCARILRHDGRSLNLNPDFLIYDTDDQTSLYKQIYRSLGINPQKYKLNSLRAIISQAKNELIDASDFQQQAEDDYQHTAAKVYLKYQQLLTQQQAVDFDDLLFKTVRLLQTNSEVLAKYQNQLSHILIDEYQDTNHAQYQLTKLLGEPQENIFIVGDFSQSIYAWRGADYRNLFYFKQDFPKLTEYKLEHNYRSSAPILAAASKLIAYNTTHPVLKLWTEKESTQPITIIEASSSDQEALAVVDQINRLKDYQQTAILYRTNAQSRAFEDALVQAGIPYRLIGGFKFYERQEIKDLLAYLRLVSHPDDIVSQTRVLKIGRRRYQRFLNWTQTEKAISIANQSPYQLLTEIIKNTAFEDKFDPHQPEDQQRLENIQELLNVATQFNDLTAFLENVSLVQDDQLKDLPISATQSQVTLMSLHSAKGLEFKTVFLVGLEEGLLPHSLSLFDPEKIEEERRLCYVGMTRAKEQLILTYAHRRWLYGRASQTHPSRFLSQIPTDLTIHHYFDFGLSAADRQTWPAAHQSANQLSNQTPAVTDSDSKIDLQIDDAQLDALLNDELDIDEFLRH